MPVPNFLIIGAPKCGTTSLHQYLSQHPQLFMSQNKEPHFFAYAGKMPDFCGPGDDLAGTNRTSVVQWEDYKALFEGAGDAIAIGEASTMYLYWPEAPERIHHYLPQTKLIAILRHPVERAFSHYLHLRGDGREWLADLQAAIDQEDTRIAQHYAPAWHYRRVGLYGEQIRRYLDRFSRDQMRIYLYEDLKRDQMGVIQDIFEFLELDPRFQPDTSVRHNVYKEVRKSQWLHQFLTHENPVKTVLRPLIPKPIRQQAATKAYKQNYQPAPKFDPTLKPALIHLFKDDILQLQDLIQRDLSHWIG